MKLTLLLFAIFIARANSLFQLPSCDSCDTDCNDNEESAREYVDSLNNLFLENVVHLMEKLWNYYTNITDENENAMVEQYVSANNFAKNISSKLRKFTWNQFNNLSLVRLATTYFVKGDDIPDDIYKKQEDLFGKLNTRYSTATVCKFKYRNDTNCTKEIDLDPGIKNVMASRRDYDELLYYWIEWRKAVGDYLREDYIEFTKISQEAAKSKGFKDLNERWFQEYEVDDLPSLLRGAYSEPFKHQGENISLEILYQEIHNFVKGKLIKIYNKEGAELIKKDGPIPAHLLGDMWTEKWHDLIDIVLPFPNARAINVTKELIDQDYKPKDLFKLAEEFFVSLGFEPMTQKFWNYSSFEKPVDGRKKVCILTAWDFYRKDDYRISMCTLVTYKHFIDVHNRMGEVVYFMQYRNNPFAYRKNPNLGFAQAVGDLASLAVNTPSHLRQLGLLKAEDNSTDDFVVVENGTQYKQEDINYLMKQALSWVVSLPYTLALDSWRWNFSSGKINETNLNEDYWRLRNKIQGVAAPVPRNEKNLDPAAKFFVPATRFFFGRIAQFQLYEGLCKKSGEYDPENVDGKPLHLCDFSVGGRQTGKVLRDMMEKGYSEHWTLALKQVTGTDHLSGDSMVKYFLPLYKYLKQENAKSGITTWK